MPELRERVRPLRVSELAQALLASLQIEFPSVSQPQAQPQPELRQSERLQQASELAQALPEPLRAEPQLAPQPRE